MSGYSIDYNDKGVKIVIDDSNEEVPLNKVIELLNAGCELEHQAHRLLVHSHGAVEKLELVESPYTWVLQRIVEQVKEFLEKLNEIR